MSLSFSKRWASYLASRTGQSSENEAILAYVIEVFAINLINTTAILSLGFIFNVLPATITCLITIALLRFTAGGAHSNSAWRCATITAVVFITIAIISSYLALISKLYLDVIAILVIITGLVLVVRLAPVDSPSAPIISASRRKRLRFLSVLVIIFVAMTILILRESTWIHAKEVQTAMILCVLWGSFNLTKLGHRLMSLIDSKQAPMEKEVY